MQSVPIITLTTDFGYRDPLNAVMKGVILAINPVARIIDLTHGVGKFNVREAALIVGMNYREFPSRTIHLVVVDPGVGSARRPLLVVTEDHYLVGPDNGVFSMVYDSCERLRERLEVFHITAEHYFRRDRSATFHGRDVFAPIAAWLSKGIETTNFGDEVKDFVRFSIASPSMATKTSLEGEVVFIDAFGNVITNITSRDIVTLRSAKPDGRLRFLMKGKDVGFRKFYSQAEDKSLYALINSTGNLEIFVYRGDAATDFDIKVGDAVGVMLV